MLELCSSSRQLTVDKQQNHLLANPPYNVNRLTLETKKITEKSFHMIFWDLSQLILSPTSECTHDLVVLVQRAIKYFQTAVEELFKQRAKR